MLPYLQASDWTADVLTSTALPQEKIDAWSEQDVQVSVLDPVDWPQDLGDAVFPLLRSLRPRRRRPGTGGHVDVEESSQEELLRAVQEVEVWKKGDRLNIWSAAGRSYAHFFRTASEVLWAKKAARKGRQLARQKHYDVVVVSTPPHWTQLAGVRIARKAGLPLVIDLRDPWAVGMSEMEGFEPAVIPALERPVETRFQRSASVVVHNTEPARKRAIEFTPPLPEVRRVVVPNGYDRAPPSTKVDRSVFRILLSGWLYPFMDPRPLLGATARLVAQHDISPSSLRIQFLGSPDTLGNLPMHAVMKAHGLSDHADLIDRVPRHEALAMQARAAVLVAFDYPHPLCVVMKAYDYLQMGGTLLFLSDGDEGSLDRLARAVGSETVSSRDEDEILRVLDAAFRKWQEGGLDGPHDPDGEFHRSKAAASMLQVLDELAYESREA